MLNLDQLMDLLRGYEGQEDVREAFLLTLDESKAKSNRTRSRDKDIWSLTNPVTLEENPRSEAQGVGLENLDETLEILGHAAESSAGNDHEFFIVVHQRSRDKDIWSLTCSPPPGSLVGTFLVTRERRDLDRPNGEPRPDALNRPVMEPPSTIDQPPADSRL